MIINKSTESGRFDWIKIYLRPIWATIFALYSLYLLQKPWIMDIAVELYKRYASKPLLGYLICGLIGALIFCCYWWFAGKMFTITVESSEDNFAAKIQAWLDDPVYTVQKVTAKGAVFLFNVVTNNKSVVVILCRESNKNVIVLDTMFYLSPVMQADFNSLQKEKRGEIIEKISIELLKLNHGFPNINPSFGEIVLEDDIPINELSDKASLREKIFKIESASFIYFQMLDLYLNEQLKVDHKYSLIYIDYH